MGSSRCRAVAVGGRRRKLQGAGVPRELVAQRLGVNQRRWEEIERACSVGVVPLGVGELG